MESATTSATTTSTDGGYCRLDRQGVAWLDARHGVEAITWDDVSTRITVSLGVAALADANEDLPALLRRVDAALYTAKHLGRNRTVIAPKLVPPPRVEVSDDPRWQRNTGAWTVR